MDSSQVRGWGEKRHFSISGSSNHCQRQAHTRLTFPKPGTGNTQLQLPVKSHLVIVIFHGVTVESCENGKRPLRWLLIQPWLNYQCSFAFKMKKKERKARKTVGFLANSYIMFPNSSWQEEGRREEAKWKRKKARRRTMRKIIMRGPRPGHLFHTGSRRGMYQVKSYEIIIFLQVKMVQNQQVDMLSPTLLPQVSLS